MAGTDPCQEADDLARTLEWLCDNDYIPGLLPKQVMAAANLLRRQAEGLRVAGVALAAKQHTVEVTAKPEPGFRTLVKATFIMADPLIYWVEHTHNVDMAYVAGDQRLREEITRHIVAVVQAQQRDRLLAPAHAAVCKALKQLELEHGR